jgi:uncharacterized protein YdaU (DUF1376 family)
MDFFLDKEDELYFGRCDSSADQVRKQAAAREEGQPQWTTPRIRCQTCRDKQNLAMLETQ